VLKKLKKLIDSQMIIDKCIEIGKNKRYFQVEFFSPEQASGAY
jgi:hypothetical protein